MSNFTRTQLFLVSLVLTCLFPFIFLTSSPSLSTLVTPTLPPPQMSTQGEILGESPTEPSLNLSTVGVGSHTFELGLGEETTLGWSDKQDLQVVRLNSSAQAVLGTHPLHSEAKWVDSDSLHLSGSSAWGNWTYVQDGAGGITSAMTFDSTSEGQFVEHNFSLTTWTGEAFPSPFIHPLSLGGQFRLAKSDGVVPELNYSIYLDLRFQVDPSSELPTNFGHIYLVLTCTDYVAGVRTLQTIPGQPFSVTNDSLGRVWAIHNNFDTPYAWNDLSLDISTLLQSLFSEDDNTPHRHNFYRFDGLSLVFQTRDISAERSFEFLLRDLSLTSHLTDDDTTFSILPLEGPSVEKSDLESGQVAEMTEVQSVSVGFHLQNYSEYNFANIEGSTCLFLTHYSSGTKEVLASPSGSTELAWIPAEVPNTAPLTPLISDGAKDLWWIPSYRYLWLTPDNWVTASNETLEPLNPEVLDFGSTLLPPSGWQWWIEWPNHLGSTVENHTYWLSSNSIGHDSAIVVWEGYETGIYVSGTVSGGSSETLRVTLSGGTMVQERWVATNPLGRFETHISPEVGLFDPGNYLLTVSVTSPLNFGWWSQEVKVVPFNDILMRVNSSPLVYNLSGLPNQLRPGKVVNMSFQCSSTFDLGPVGVWQPEVVVVKVEGVGVTSVPLSRTNPNEDVLSQNVTWFAPFPLSLDSGSATMYVSLLLSRGEVWIEVELVDTTLPWDLSSAGTSNTLSGILPVYGILLVALVGVGSFQFFRRRNLGGDGGVNP